MTKICLKCERNLPISSFNKRAKSTDGLSTRCRTCSRKSANDYYHKTKTLKGKVKNLQGKTFGRLRVISQDGWYITPSTGKKNAYWTCECICGKRTKVRSYGLISGSTSSCGCYRIEQIKKFTRKQPGEAQFNKLYNTYKIQAFYRDLDFTLSKEDFRILTKSNCFYCDTKPAQLAKGYSKSTTKEWQNRCVYVYNGIDRINNLMGYTIENSKACCANCNFAKGELGQDQFKDLINKIYNHWAKK